MWLLTRYENLLLKRLRQMVLNENLLIRIPGYGAIRRYIHGPRGVL